MRFNTMGKNGQALSMICYVIVILAMLYSGAAMMNSNCKTHCSVLFIASLLVLILMSIMLFTNVTESFMFTEKATNVDCPTCKIKENFTPIRPSAYAPLKQTSLTTTQAPEYTPKSAENVMPVDQQLAVYSGNFMPPIAQVVFKPNCFCTSFNQIRPSSPTPSNELGRVRGFQIPALNNFTLLISCNNLAVSNTCSRVSAPHGPEIIRGSLSFVIQVCNDFISKIRNIMYQTSNLLIIVFLLMTVFF